MSWEGAATDTAEPVRVLVVDDDPGFRESITTLLGSQELLVVGEAASGPEALNLASSTDPDVVLMDVRMPAMDGIETTRRIKDLLPWVGVIALTGFEDQRVVREMLVAGASGYVLKDSDGAEIVLAVRQAAAGGGFVSDAITPSVVEELIEALTKERARTREVEAAQTALLERDARRHDLVSRLGHELREPVSEIVEMARAVAGSAALAEGRTELLDRLVDRAGDLAQLARRLEAAVETGLTEWADVSGLVREVAGGRERVVVRTLGSPAMAGLNRLAATRILEELLDNALAYTCGEVTIDVTMTSSTPEVRVRDSGPGIDPDLADSIFDPLERAKPVPSRNGGLGLAIARMSARAMNGEVSLESTGPAGSTFLWRVTSVP